MDLALVYSKTPKGLAEVKARSGSLSLQARRVLIMVDGRRPVGEIEWVVRGGELASILENLEAEGLIEVTSTAENVVSAAQAAIAAAAEVSEQWQATVPLHPRTPDAVPPRPATLGGVRPGTVRREAPPTTLSEALARRPGTMTGVPVPAPNASSTTGGATVASPTPAAPATLQPVQQVLPVGTVGGAVTPERRAESQPAPAPVLAAASKPVMSLEETKNLAVRELFQRIGPYGEAPAKNIKECTTIDGLREQVRAASRRVASLRGDKAAQEYLNALSHLMSPA